MTLVRRAVVLSERYINDRFLPDKAIDLLDEACACAALRNHGHGRIRRAQHAELRDRSTQEEDAMTNGGGEIDYEELAKLRCEICCRWNRRCRSWHPQRFRRAGRRRRTSPRSSSFGLESPPARVQENELKKLARLGRDAESKDHRAGRGGRLRFPRRSAAAGCRSAPDAGRLRLSLSGPPAWERPSW